MRIAFISISRDEEKVLRLKLFDKIENQSMEFFNRHGIGELMSRLTNDITSYREVLGPGVMYPIFFITLVIPGLVALYYLSPLLATLSLAPLFLIPIINLLIRKHIYQASYETTQTLAELSNRVQEDYSGIRIIKSYEVQETIFERFKTLCERFSKINMRLDILQGIFYPLLTLITRLTTLALVLFFGLMIRYAWGHFGAADFVSFMWVQSYIYFPILMMGWVLPIYERGRAAYDRLRDLYDEPVVVRSSLSKLHIPHLADIRFNHLTFSYPGSSRIVLKDINTTIAAGSFVGLTGPTGSGKTTLFKLLDREYELPTGMILIGGRDIHDYPLEAFRQSVVSVEQLPFLFSQTIGDNVRFGRLEATQQQIEFVSSQADLHETVMTFPERYETLVGERGITLSGGQKQRVAMARAFLVNRSILLLDDIFSNVDAATEKKILEVILKEFRGKTLLLVTHRISVLEHMERVLYFKEGQIVEDGTPRELLVKGGYYAALAELQRIRR